MAIPVVVLFLHGGKQSDTFVAMSVPPVPPGLIVPSDQITIGEKIGKGASGFVRAATLAGKPVVVKASGGSSVARHFFPVVDLLLSCAVFVTGLPCH
jgi:hypothetical protein